MAVQGPVFTPLLLDCVIAAQRHLDWGGGWWGAELCSRMAGTKGSWRRRFTGQACRLQMAPGVAAPLDEDAKVAAACGGGGSRVGKGAGGWKEEWEEAGGVAPLAASGP